MDFLKFIAVIVFGASFLYSQAHLDPANYPSFGSPTWCDTAGKKAAYEELWKGLKTYSVGLGTLASVCMEGCPARYYAPVIDGYLEDSLWYNAETLLINSWEVSGYDECCNSANPKFTGARDLHAIWRFFYDYDGLYIGCEVHDDVHDVDSLKAWYAQDGIEIGIDPWDWGDAAKDYWTSEPSQFRRYLYPPPIICDPGPCVTWESADHFLHILKRMNEEPYLAGLIHGKQLNNYGRGDEATNFSLGSPDIYGIQFAVNSQGVDPYFRQIHHIEFKFPFHNELWPKLDILGFYGTSGLPRAGNVFKMSFSNNDDDIQGPDGENPNYSTSSIWRADPFIMQEPSGHDHWSDMKYYPVFAYVGRTISRVHVQSGIARHGDSRIAGLWVDAETERTRYAFSGSGAVVIGNSSYFYDSTDAAGGKISDASGIQQGVYIIKKTGTSSYRDTLLVTLELTRLTLLRFLATCCPIEHGRWVEVNDVPDTIRDGFCDTTVYRYSIKPDAREYRFCALMGIDTHAVPAFRGCIDSLRVYDYASDSFMYEFGYNYDKAFLGRDSTYCTFVFAKLIDAEKTTTPRHLIVKYPNGDSAIFQEIKPYPLNWLGETGNNINKTLTILADTARKLSTDSLLKMYIFDKYNNKVNLYPDPATPTSKYRIMIYPDMVLCVDSLRAFSWQKVFDCHIQLDSFELLGTDSIRVKDSSEVWPDSSLILQRHIITFSSPESRDTFIFQDTTRVTYWEDLELTRPYYPYNLIDPSPCPAVEKSVVSEARVMELMNFPNPFNPSTTIRFTIPGTAAVERYVLNVYDIRGRLVRTLIKGKTDRFGVRKQVVWNGMDNSGKMVGTGVYYYRLQCGNRIKKGTLVIVK